MTLSKEHGTGSAYVLLEVKPGSSDDVARMLATMKRSPVRYAAAVWGPWDVIARVSCSDLPQLLIFIDRLRQRTNDQVRRTETLWMRHDQLEPDRFHHLPKRMAFVMLRVKPESKFDDVKKVLRYVRAGRANSARVWHAAGVLGPYDIATTIGYDGDVDLKTLVMKYFQAEGCNIGDTITIPTISDMVYPKHPNVLVSDL